MTTVRPVTDVVGCPCGLVHQVDARTWAAYSATATGKPAEELVEVPGVGAWMVPRLFAALHGLRAAALPELAATYGWPEAGPGT